MQASQTIRFGAIALSAFLGVLAAADAQTSSPCSDAQAGKSRAPRACEIIREIDDPHTGQHWLLLRDPANPGGPGVLALQSSIKQGARVEEAIVELRPVIHAGDRVAVAGSNAHANLTLEGVALAPAGVGVEFRVRLEFSGKEVETVALGPGRAALIPEKGFWP